MAWAAGLSNQGIELSVLATGFAVTSGSPSSVPRTRPSMTLPLESRRWVAAGKLTPLLNKVSASETSKRLPRMMPFMSGTKSSRISRSGWDSKKRFSSSRLDIL